MFRIFVNPFCSLKWMHYDNVIDIMISIMISQLLALFHQTTTLQQRK